MTFQTSMAFALTASHTADQNADSSVHFALNHSAKAPTAAPRGAENHAAKGVITCVISHVMMSPTTWMAGTRTATRMSTTWMTAGRRAMISSTSGGRIDVMGSPITGRGGGNADSRGRIGGASGGRACSAAV